MKATTKQLHFFVRQKDTFGLLENLSLEVMLILSSAVNRIEEGLWEALFSIFLFFSCRLNAVFPSASSKEGKITSG